VTAIVGVFTPGKTDPVKKMLKTLNHRGPIGQDVIQTKNATLGVAWTALQIAAANILRQFHVATDEAGDGHCALAVADDFILKRDPLGVAPLYFGKTADGVLPTACTTRPSKGWIVVPWHMACSLMWLSWIQRL
jgi:asparagine synthase (glutamine-hydrolysing)